mmetsp:Transcript_10541/g.64692  ORF Transcript_10541/g.64692 Transcript_10541/m.64692 type:complete len:331 (-) Transcript_10541:998-1990(-)
MSRGTLGCSPCSSIFRSSFWIASSLAAFLLVVRVLVSFASSPTCSCFSSVDIFGASTAFAWWTCVSLFLSTVGRRTAQHSPPLPGKTTPTLACSSIHASSPNTLATIPHVGSFLFLFFPFSFPPCGISFVGSATASRVRWNRSTRCRIRSCLLTVTATALAGSWTFPILSVRTRTRHSSTISFLSRSVVGSSTTGSTSIFPPVHVHLQFLSSSLRSPRLPFVPCVARGADSAGIPRHNRRVDGCHTSDIHPQGNSRFCIRVSTAPGAVGDGWGGAASSTAHWTRSCIVFVLAAAHVAMLGDGGCVEVAMGSTCASERPGGGASPTVDDGT